MESLQNGCRCSSLTVCPATWERANASIKNQWYINYRFYDPLFKEKYPNGYQKRIKGMNVFHTLKERQDAVRILIADELKRLRERGYNPILDEYLDPPVKTDYIISPELQLCYALQKAFERQEGVPNALADIKSTLKYIQEAAAQLRLDQMPVKDLRRRHVVMILDQCKKFKTTWTDATYNRYLKNLSAILKQLVKVEALEHNPCRDIEFKKRTKAIKVVLAPEQRKAIDEKLRAENYTFWRFIHIFFHSGARTTEMMQVRKEDVNLQRQMVKYTVKKGTLIREVERPIKNSVLYLWEQLICEAAPGQYLFSKGLVPGDNAIGHAQIKRRWRTWVQRDQDNSGDRKCGRKTVHARKAGMGIKVSWYSLKHLNTDEMENMYGTDVAARLNEHSPEMVRNHYAVNHVAREHEIIRNATNTFVPAEIKKPA